MLRNLGETTDSGELVFHTPERVGRRAFALYADKPGFELGFAVTVGRNAQFRMRDAAPVPVVLRGESAKVARVVGMAPFADNLHRASRFFGSRRVPTRGSRPARWLLEGVGDRFWVRLEVPAKPPAAVLTEILVGPAQPIVIDFDRVPRIPIQVRDDRGSPIGCALAVGRLGPGVGTNWQARLASDQAGRAELVLGAGKYIVYATTGDSHGVAMVDAETRDPVKLVLKPLDVMQVRVVDGDGKPVQGAVSYTHLTLPTSDLV